MRLLPRIFRMVREERSGKKITAARVSQTSHDAHIFCHRSVGRLSLHSSARIVTSPSPQAYSAGRSVHVPAERALVRFFLLLKTVGVIAQHLLRQGNINLAFAFLEQLLPSRSPGIRRSGLVVWIESRCVQL